MKSERLQLYALLAEVLGGVAVVVTLIVLIFQVSENSRLIEMQRNIERSDTLTRPFLDTQDLSAILVKISEKDGYPATVLALAEEYDLTMEEATAWDRLLLSTWLPMMSEYNFSGITPGLQGTVRGLISSKDQQIFIQNTGVLSGEFLEYVLSML